MHIMYSNIILQWQLPCNLFTFAQVIKQGLNLQTANVTEDRVLATRILRLVASRWLTFSLLNWYSKNWVCFKSKNIVFVSSKNCTPCLHKVFNFHRKQFRSKMKVRILLNEPQNIYNTHCNCYLARPCFQQFQLPYSGCMAKTCAFLLQFQEYSLQGKINKILETANTI